MFSWSSETIGHTYKVTNLIETMALIHGASKTQFVYNSLILTIIDTIDKAKENIVQLQQERNISNVS